jgi:hypothetical protein
MIQRPIKAAGEPSDLELMLYADGELDEDRRPAVEAYLARGTTGATKLGALHLVSGIVREQSLGAAGPADGIADAVMAKLTANGAGAASKPTPITMGLQATSIPGPRSGPSATGAPRTKAANDNARGIFALASIAVAAAAALMIWGRMDASTQAPQGPVAAMNATPEQLPAPPAPAKIAEPTPDVEGEHGVEVAAVDFGARMGSIFYVPSGAAASNATTTVVWLNDDAAGGE